jgi:hypothetical protein
LRIHGPIVPALVLCAGIGALAAGSPLAASDDVIRLRPGSRSGAAGAGAAEAEPVRRGFDYEAFEARLESLWFQRKAFLADGRVEDAAQQAERIRTFCQEEGVGRLGFLAGALVAEAARYRKEGRHDEALASLRPCSGPRATPRSPPPARSSRPSAARSAGRSAT